MSQPKKYLVCVYFDRQFMGAVLPSDRVFVVSAEGDAAACQAVLSVINKLEDVEKINSCTSRLLNSVLSNPFYCLESEVSDAHG